MTPGRRNLITDVAGLGVGNAADPRLKSGATVILAMGQGKIASKAIHEYLETGEW